MKITPSIALLALLSSTAIVLTGCSKENKDTAKDVAHDTATAAKDMATDVKNAAVNTWDRIKDYSFEKKDDFADGLDKLAQKTDEKVDSMADKTAPARAEAVAEYKEARATLKTQLGNLREASADTWDATKEKTNEAWKGVQAAYEKVKNSADS